MFGITHSKVKMKAFLIEKSFFFLPSLTARIPCFGKQGLWRHIVCFYSDLGCLCNGKIKPQAYPCDVCAGKRIRKRKELSAALAVLWARWTGLWGQWLVCHGKEVFSVHMGWAHLGWLAKAHHAAQASSHRDHPC